MPKLETFDAGNLALRPTEVGVEAQAGAARRIGAFFSQQASAVQMLGHETDRLASLTDTLGRETSNLGSEKGAALAQAGRAIGGGIAAAGDAAVKYMDHQQINHGAASWADLLQQVTDDWNNRVKNADPNNPHVATDFMQSLNDRLANFKENGFTTENSQRWAESHVDALRQHMVEKTNADMSTLAGQAAVVNTQQTINKLSATVHGDPSSIDFALAGLKSSTEGLLASSPNIKGTDAARVRTEILQKGSEAIVKAAAVGYIEKTASMPPWVTDPKYAPYVNGPELTMLEKAAKVQQKTELLQQKQLETYNKQIADQKVHEGANKIFSDNVKTDPATGDVTVNPNYFKQTLDLVRANPGAPNGASTARTMLDWGERIQKREDATSDPQTRENLFSGMLNDRSPVTVMDVLKAQAEGKLSNKDAALMKEIIQQNVKGGLNDPVFKGVMDAAKRTIEQSLQGDENYGKFFYGFVRDYQAKAQAGTLPPNALDMSDDKSMISQYLKQYRPTVEERAQYHLFKNLGSNPADIDFSKVTGGGGPPRVSTKEQYDKLPAGTRYISTKDGQTYEKR